ncbi:MAG: F0F1 ATP synthase subunit B [Bacteroidia bacterium]|nr:F0F1 ATP synthase subunit B [Bacteroidia bacterium]
MALLTPQLGLFAWTLIIFLVFFFLLRKMAWKPILNALKEREDTIENSLRQAEQARLEMQKLTADNESLLREARAERDRIIKEANVIRDQIVADARKAAAEAEAKEREKTKQQIEAEKRAAIAEIKQTSAAIAIEVAEKILRREFADKSSQENFARQLIADLN